MTDSERPELLGANDLRLTVEGRISGFPRTVTLWFAHQDGSVYFLAHARAHGRGTDWYRNLMAAGHAHLELGGVRLEGRWRPMEDLASSRAFVTGLFREKYGRAAVAAHYEGSPRVPVRIELSAS